MKFVAKAQESRERDANMMMRGSVEIQTAKVLCLRLQCLEHTRKDALKLTNGTEGQVNGMSRKIKVIDVVLSAPYQIGEYQYTNICKTVQLAIPDDGHDWHVYGESKNEVIEQEVDNETD